MHRRANTELTAVEQTRSICGRSDMKHELSDFFFVAAKYFKPSFAIHVTVVS